MTGKTLITGASGLVGANLVRSLLQAGREVRAVVHSDQRALQNLDVELANADVRDLASLERATQGVEVVYHLAGAISLEMDSAGEMMAVNTFGTRHVVQACLTNGVRRLVYFSSIDALQVGPPGVPIDESQPLLEPVQGRRIPPYDLSKAEGEREVQRGIQQGLEAVILRPSAILGPFDFKPSYLGQALILLARGKIPALVKGGFDWVDVRDVVTAAIQAEQAAPPGAVYLLGGTYDSIRNVAGLVTAYTGRPAPGFTVPMSLARAFAPVMLQLAHFNGSQPIYTRVTLDVLRSNRQVSSDKARRELGYHPRPLPDTIGDTLGWFRRHSYLHRERQ